MAGSQAIRDQLYSILDNMSAVAGTVKTVAKHIPRGVADYEGYIIRIRMLSSANRRGAEWRGEAHQWAIQVMSPPYDLGFYDETEDAMYAYRDAVLAELEGNTALAYTGTPIAGISGALVTSDAFQWGVDTEYGFRYVWQATMSMENKVLC